MAGGIIGCLILGSLFLYLAARSYRRTAKWRGAVRLRAVVKFVQYREAWERKAEINDHHSHTEATLCFTDQGRTYEKCRQYSGILHAPICGDEVPILFNRASGDWCLRKEARTHHRLFLALGCLSIAACAALFLNGKRIIADLAEYRVDAPNLAGSIVCALVGVICAAFAYACIRGLMPDLVRSLSEPVIWIFKFYVLHRYEEVDARCVGIIPPGVW